MNELLHKNNDLSFNINGEENVTARKNESYQ